MSTDFDPRTLWSRRELIVAGGAGVGLVAFAGPGAACEAEWTGRGGLPAVLVTDAGIVQAQARRLAHLAGARLAVIPDREDTLRFWSGALQPGLKPGGAVIGVTRWADYLVLRGAAAEAGLRVRFETGRPGDAAYADAGETLETALAAEPAAARGRIGWILA